MQIRIVLSEHYWVRKPKFRNKIDFNFLLFTGSVEKGVVEVTNCFCVPHKESDDQVEAEITYALDVYDLNRRVNSSESIVGMFIRST